MKDTKLKIFLILLMLVPFPFGCKDDCQTDDELRYVLPYWQMQDMVLDYVDLWYINRRTGRPMFSRVTQEFDTHVYSCENMALRIVVPDTALFFHDFIAKKNGFSFTQEAIACNRRQPGYAGTRDLVDKIYISSRYDFDEMHLAGMNMSDIVDIFAYTTNGENSWSSLDEYNRNSPYEAPKRFYLLIKRPARLSNKQQFVIRYLLFNEIGEVSREFEVVTPVFNVEVR